MCVYAYTYIYIYVYIYIYIYIYIEREGEREREREIERERGIVVICSPVHNAVDEGSPESSLAGWPAGRSEPPS